jgi:hypothetical protein
MRSKELSQQYEQGLALTERMLAVLQSQLDRSEAQRLSDRAEYLQKWAEFNTWIEGVRTLIHNQTSQLEAGNAQLADALGGKIDRGNAGIVEAMNAHTKHVVAVMEKVVEVVGIPKGDTPTVEELLSAARSDPARRALVEQTMADLEFEDTEIQFP